LCHSYLCSWNYYNGYFWWLINIAKIEIMAMKILSSEKPEEALKFLKMELVSRQLKNHHWKTKTGKLIPLKEMTEDHLKNTIAMLKRNLNGDLVCPIGRYPSDDIWWK
jgi:hypothetical protein